MAVTLHDHETGPRRVSILGSTGSVGCNTVDLLRRAPDAYSVEALTARTNVDVLASQARELRPRMAVIADESLFGDLKVALAGTTIAVAAGPDALVEAASLPADWVMAAIVGAAGLAPTLAAIRGGGTVALA
ncbi:MAG: 1-deoxy-D-xylulose-5-phosphate reductoisomerase, partial [Alphaproteobacteria bacterium]